MSAGVVPMRLYPDTTKRFKRLRKKLRVTADSTLTTLLDNYETHSGMHSNNKEKIHA